MNFVEHVQLIIFKSGTCPFTTFLDGFFWLEFIRVSLSGSGLKMTPLPRRRRETLLQLAWKMPDMKIHKMREN